MMDGSCGVDEVRYERLLAHFSSFSILRPNEDEEADISTLPLRLIPFGVGALLSLMAATNAFVLPYLSYCRRHLSRRHSGRAREKKKEEGKQRQRSAKM